MTLDAAVAASRANLKAATRLGKAYAAVQLARDPRRHHARSALRLKLALESDWADALAGSSNTLFRLVETSTLDDAIAFAQHAWAEKTLFRPVRKTGPDEQEIRDRLVFGIDEAAWTTGAMSVYLGMALQTSEEAGTFSLRALGLGRTWAWANPRAMAPDLFAVRGSKVVQSMYGQHMDALSRIIQQATDPANPKTLQEVRGEIKELWPELQRYQVDRIARTETATVWSTTSANAYQANGITQFESTIAQGPSIGVESEDACDECVDASQSVHSIEDDLPPWHPNCRCEIVPVLEDDDGTPWLPPDEPFTGQDAEGLAATPDLEG